MVWSAEVGTGVAEVEGSTQPLTALHPWTLNPLCKLYYFTEWEWAAGSVTADWID